MNKTNKLGISFSFAFLSSLEGVMQLFERVFKNIDLTKNVENMTTGMIMYKVVFFILTAILCYYFLDKLDKLKVDVKNTKEGSLMYADNHKEDVENSLIIIDTIRNRQSDFLWNYIEAYRTGQQLPIAPNNWLTDLEILQYDELIKKRKELSDSIKQKFITLN